MKDFSYHMWRSSLARLEWVLILLVLLASFAFAQQPQTQTAPIYAVNAKYTNGVAPGYAPTAGTGLSLMLGPGTANCSGTIETYAAGTLALTASTTNYIYLNVSGNCAPSVKTSAFTATDIPIATVVTGSSAITSITDDRTFFESGPTVLSGWVDVRNPQFGGGAACNGTTNDTTAVQDAINYGAAHQIPISLWGCPALYVGTLTTPSNTEIYAFKTLITLVNGTDEPLLENPDQSFTTRTDQNITIHGGIWNANGGNQSSTTPEGVLTQGVQFCGVQNLHFDSMTVENARRFNVWVLNTLNFTVSGGLTVFNGNFDVNEAGLQINGNTSNVNIDSITFVDGEDDAFAINADDVDMGGNYSSANIDGPISNVHVGQVNCQSCNDGVRIQAPIHAISNVDIRMITGDFTDHGLVMQDYGLGSGGQYDSIRIGQIDVNYNQILSGYIATAVVYIDTQNVNTGVMSDVHIGTIHRNQTSGDTTDTRPTLYLDHTAYTKVAVGNIEDTDSSAPEVVEVGDPLVTELSIGSVNRFGATTAGPIIAMTGGVLNKLELDSLITNNTGDITYPVALSGATVNSLVYGANYYPSSGSTVVDLASTSTIGGLWLMGANQTQAAIAAYTADGTSVVDQQFPTRGIFSNGASVTGVIPPGANMLNLEYNGGAYITSYGANTTTPGELHLRGDSSDDSVVDYYITCIPASCTFSGVVSGTSLQTTQTPTASSTASNYSVPIDLNGTTYYIRLSSTQ